MPKTSSKCLNNLLDDDGMKDKHLVARASIDGIDNTQLANVFFKQLEEDFKQCGLGEKTTTRNAEITSINNPEADGHDATFNLENKKKRLEDWLHSTLKLKRVLTSNVNIEQEDDEDDEFTRIGDPYNKLRYNDIKSIEGKTDKR